MDLRTTYLGLELAHPLMPGASPLCDDLDMAQRLVDAGAPALVLRSLFEEQVLAEELAAERSHHGLADAHAEARGYLPPASYTLGPDEYLEHLSRLKTRVSVPVIASLNGTTPGGWVDHARWIEEAGADALELNTWHLATDPDVTGTDVEWELVDILAGIRARVRIPVAVKLGPSFSSLPNLVRRLEKAGADGLVLFNRFYQPDIDVETLEVTPELELSSPSELRLRLRWLAALSGRTTLSLGCSGGVHGAIDALKALMAGAHAVQMVSALLRHGPEVLTETLRELRRWLLEHEYESVRQLQGSMSLIRCPDPRAYERANYLRVLTSWSDDARWWRPAGRRRSAEG